MSRPVVVLGMHRSGTSFLVRALNLSGLWLGPNDALYTVEGKAAIGNPKGNYEYLDAVRLNDELLASSGGRWDVPPLILKSSESQDRRMRDLLASLRETQPPKFARWGWKDPRTIVTFDAWSRVLDSGADVVAIFRHPRLVAESLYQRSGLSLQEGYRLWLHYNSLLIRHLDENSGPLLRFDVSYSSLTDQLDRTCSSLGLRFNPDLISAWYDQKLVRNTLPEQDRSSEFVSVDSTWQALLERHADLLAR